jgi:hypothetical protein
MPSRRDLLRLTGGAAATGLCGLLPPTAFAGVGPDARPSGGRLPKITIMAPHRPDPRHPFPIGIRIGPLRLGQRVEFVELLLPQRAFPGLGRFATADQFPEAALDCSVRVEPHEILVVGAQLSDGTCLRSVSLGDSIRAEKSTGY